MAARLTPKATTQPTASTATSVPVITKPAAGRSLPGEAGEIFALTADAHDLYVLGCPAREERRCGGDWRASPFVL